MEILAIGISPPMDSDILRTLSMRGYEVTATDVPVDGLDRGRLAEFDCVLLDVRSSGNSLSPAEVRDLLRRIAVVTMTTETIESIVSNAVDDGSIEFLSMLAFLSRLEFFPKPVLVAGPVFHPSFRQAIQARNIHLSTANTLQFALSLLADGWSQIVYLQSDVPGRSGMAEVAVFHRIAVKELAILASGLSGIPTGITHCRRPQNAREFIVLFENVSDSWHGPCGLTEPLGSRTSW